MTSTPNPAEGGHLPVIPLSEVLLRLEHQLSPREVKDLIACLALHVVNLSNKVKGLEARLAQPTETEDQRLPGGNPVGYQPIDDAASYRPGDSVTGG